MGGLLSHNIWTLEEMYLGLGMKLFFKISAIPNIYETRYFKAYQHKSEGPNQSQSNWSKAVEIVSSWIHQTSKNVWAKKEGALNL